MKKLSIFLSLFLGCFWLFGSLSYPSIHNQTRPELLSKFFASNKVNNLLSNSQRHRVPREKHDLFRSGHISHNFQGASEATVWARTYGGFRDDEACIILQTSDGGYIVAGHTNSFASGSIDYDFWILKLSPGGNVEWQHTYGEFHWEKHPSIFQTSDGGYIVGGYTGSFGAGGFDFWVLKLDLNGLVEWERAYGGNSGEAVESIQQTSDGGYIVVGLTNSFGGRTPDLLVLKLTSNGDIEWERAYGGSSWEGDWLWKRRKVTVQQTSDGGYILVSDTESFGAGGRDIWVVKLLLNGDIDWQRTYGGEKHEELYRSGPHIQQTSDGGYILVSDTESFGAGGRDIWVVKLLLNGDIDWQRTYGGEKYESACAIYLTDDGGYVVGGNSNSFSSAEDLDFWVLKLDLNGVVEWERAYGGELGDRAESIQQTSNGGYVIAGFSYSFSLSTGYGGSDFLVLKLSSNGDLGPGCGLVKNSNAIVSDTSISPLPTYTDPKPTSAITEESHASLGEASYISELLSWNLNQPPENVSLKSEVNRSLFRGEAFNTISWEPNPLNSQFVIAEYRIHIKDAEYNEDYQLIGSIPSNIFTYVDDYLDLDEKFVYVVTSVDSDGNESPRSGSVSASDSVNTTESSNTIVSDARTSSSDTKVKVTRKDTKVSSQPKAISKNILVRSTLRYNSPDKSQTLIQSPANVSFTRGEASQTIHWKHRKQNVAEYRIYRKYAGEDDESYRLIGSVPGNVQAYAVYASATDEKLIFAVTAVDVNSNESEKSNPIRN